MIVKSALTLLVILETVSHRSLLTLQYFFMTHVFRAFDPAELTHLSGEISFEISLQLPPCPLKSEFCSKACTIRYHTRRVRTLCSIFHI